MSANVTTTTATQTITTTFLTTATADTPTPTPIIPLDPYAQDITIFLPDGTPIPLTLADVDYWASYGIRICINYASQIGASLVLLAVLLVLTLPQPHKRTSPVFALNALALATNGVRSILQCLYFTGPWYVAYAFFGFDYSGVPARDVGISCAASVLTLVTLGFIEASLVLQVHVVHVTARGLTKYGLLLMTALVAVMAIGFRFALTVLNCEAIVAKAPFDEWRWLAHANNITTTISIFVFSAIFVAKLALAMGDRKRLGMKQYGAMRVIFIMGCQTMVVPAIFSALQYFTDAPELGSQVITIVALFLPLSAIWAHSTMSAATGSSSSPSGAPGRRSKKPHSKISSSGRYYDGSRGEKLLSDGSSSAASAGHKFGSASTGSGNGAAAMGRKTSGATGLTEPSVDYDEVEHAAVKGGGDSGTAAEKRSVLDV